MDRRILRKILPLQKAVVDKLSPRFGEQLATSTRTDAAREKDMTESIRTTQSTLIKTAP
jgi:hypothetical protein